MGSENPDWLPEGWTVDVKVRNYGRKDKYYIDPSNGLKFSSKAEVLRHLESSAKARELKEQNKNDGKKAVAQELPPGWIKDIKTTKRGGKIRKDMFYFDPVSGCQFQSIQEVLRYLETEDSGKAESKPDDKDHISAELEDNSQPLPIEAKEQTLIDKKADKKFSCQKSQNSELELTGGSNGDTVNILNTPKGNPVDQTEEVSLSAKLSDKTQSANRAERYTNRMQKRAKDGASKEVDMPKETYAEQIQREDDSNAADLPNKLRKVSGTEESEGGMEPNKTPDDCKLENDVIGEQSLQSGSKAAAVKIIDTPEANGSEQIEQENGSVGGDRKHENVTRSNKRKKSNTKGTTSDLPRRTSKRLARVEVDPAALEAKPSNESRNTEVNTAKANGQAVLSGEPDININAQAVLSGEPDINVNEKIDECQEETNENPKNLVKENPTSKQEKEPVASSSLLNFEGNKSLEVILMDPCIEFAFKTLTGAIPIEEVKKVIQNPPSSQTSTSQASASSSALPPPADIWADPSFEFAVKTLTGEMPTEPMFRLDNSHHPSNYSFGQQGMRDPSVPPGVNGSSAGVYGHQPAPRR